MLGLSICYIVYGIILMVSDRYVCRGTGRDELWLYCVLSLTLPTGFTCICSSCLSNPDDSDTVRATKKFFVNIIPVFSFLIYGSIVLFGGGVCELQIERGGLYTWALATLMIQCIAVGCIVLATLCAGFVVAAIGKNKAEAVISDATMKPVEAEVVASPFVNFSDSINFQNQLPRAVELPIQRTDKSHRKADVKHMTKEADIV